MSCLAVLALAQLLDRNRHAAPAYDKALENAWPLPVVRRFMVLRVVVLNFWVPE